MSWITRLSDWVLRKPIPHYNNRLEIEEEETRLVKFYTGMVREDKITLREVEAELLGVAHKLLLNEYQINDPYMHARIAAQLTSQVEQAATRADGAVTDG